MATQGGPTGRSRASRTRETGNPTGEGQETNTASAEPSSQESASRASQTQSGEAQAERDRARSSGRRGESGPARWIRELASAQIYGQKHRASETLEELSRFLRSATDQFQGKPVGNYARQAADQLERLARRIDQQNLDELLQNVQRFARQRPALFVGAAFGAGLVGARIFKSSGPTAGERSFTQRDSRSFPARGPQTPMTGGAMGGGPETISGPDLTGGPIS